MVSDQSYLSSGTQWGKEGHLGSAAAQFLAISAGHLAAGCQSYLFFLVEHAPVLPGPACLARPGPASLSACDWASAIQRLQRAVGGNRPQLSPQDSLPMPPVTRSMGEE